jgi:hypothetical protein
MCDDSVMNTAIHNRIINFIKGIADDYLRGVYFREEYRNVMRTKFEIFVYYY